MKNDYSENMRFLEEFKVRQYETTLKIEKALEIANKAHEDQFRDDNTPYISHVLRVSERFDHSDLKIIALLHDVFEDSKDYSYQDLKDIFGSFIAESVKVLTKEKGYNMQDYMQNITTNFYALLVKLSDRIDNVKSLSSCPDLEKRERYILETEKYFLESGEIKEYESIRIEKMLFELEKEVLYVKYEVSQDAIKRTEKSIDHSKATLGLEGQEVSSELEIMLLRLILGDVTSEDYERFMFQEIKKAHKVPRI